MRISRRALHPSLATTAAALLALGCGGAGTSADGVDASPRVDAGVGSDAPGALPAFVICPLGSSEAGCDYFGFEGLMAAVVAAPAGSAIAPTLIAMRTGTYPAPGIAPETVFVRNTGKHLEIRGDREVVLVGDGTTAAFEATAGTTVLVSLRLDSFGVAVVASGTASVRLVDVVGRLGRSAVTLADGAVGTLTRGDFASYAENTISVSGSAQLVVRGTLVASSGNNAINVRGTASLKLSNSILRDNVARGLYIAETAALIASNNVFDRNAIAGIDAYHCGEHDPSLTLTNNVFTNTARNGDGTFGFGVGGPCSESAGKRANDTLTYNDSFGNEAQGTGCDAWEYCGGTGNTETPPGFVDALGSDYHLGGGSSLRDSGDPGVLDPDGSRSDRGVYGGPDACALDPALPGC